MDEVVKFINENWPVMVAAGVILDFIAGVLPDRFLPYIGFIKRFAVMLKGMSKKKG